MLGTVLSILFLVWFLSGMVMMYHSYPKVSQQQRMEHAETIGVATIPVNIADTVNEIDVWLIGAMPFSEYPIYHYALNDGHGSELYLSSRTGRALQITDRSSRFWAWVGAIPHWIYITRLRATGRQPWTDTVLWLSGIGIAMTLTGIIVGIRAMVQTRRRSSNAGARGLTPYVKPLFRWHHLFGLCFGLFVLTWIFSGFMSLADAPQMLWPVHENHSAADICAPQLHTGSFTLDCNEVLASADVKRLELLLLTTECCRDIVESVRGGRQVTATMLYEYDDYYVSQHQKLPLPVCRVTVDDADGSTYRPTLRRLILWPLLIGGTIVSITGLLMGCGVIA